MISRCRHSTAAKAGKAQSAEEIDTPMPMAVVQTDLFPAKFQCIEIETHEGTIDMQHIFSLRLIP